MAEEKDNKSHLFLTRNNLVVMGIRFNDKVYAKFFDLKDKKQIKLCIKGLGIGLLNTLEKVGIIANHEEMLNIRDEVFNV